MPMTDQDARALTYLARRLRDETNGACGWDDNGTYAVVSKLTGQNLAMSIERVTRHAADPEAKTPGAIQRPFIPDAQPASSNRDNPPAHERCSVCSLSELRCKLQTGNADLDHDFEAATIDRKRGPDAMAAIVQEAKSRLEPTATPPEPRAKPATTNPRIQAARDELARPEPTPTPATTDEEPATAAESEESR